VVGGFFAYHAVPTNADALNAFRDHVIRQWMRTIQRRSQKDRTTWQRIKVLAARWLSIAARNGMEIASLVNRRPGSLSASLSTSWPGLSHGCPVEFRAPWNGNLIP
jgi:GH15 family glucan-1,4-alpha-glucosidase